MKNVKIPAHIWQYVAGLLKLSCDTYLTSKSCADGSSWMAAEVCMLSCLN
uniref:Uncharacterized protein n=1 Tax=Arundo donax TaxID=35708 RepID=A0A0A8ZVM8_ARUDO